MSSEMFLAMPWLFSFAKAGLGEAVSAGGEEGFKVVWI